MKILLEPNANVNISSAEMPAYTQEDTVTRNEHVAREALAGVRTTNGQFQRKVTRTTALVSACKHGNVEIAELLVKAGADPNFQSIEGNTPVMLAVCGQHKVSTALKLMELLFTVNAD